MSASKIVHSMIQYQQQDSTGQIFNVVRNIYADGHQEFVREPIVAVETEVVFSLKSAKGHVWYLTSKTMRVAQCDHEDCAIWEHYKTTQPSPHTVAV